MFYVDSLSLLSRGYDFELIPTVEMESGHPVEGPFGREFSSSTCISLGSYSGLKSRVVGNFGQKFAFLKKRTLTGKFAEFCSERIHRLTDPRLVCKFREIWPTGNR